jgi:hypothetical protein
MMQPESKPFTAGVKVPPAFVRTGSGRFGCRALYNGRIDHQKLKLNLILSISTLQFAVLHNFIS